MKSLYRSLAMTAFFALMLVLLIAYRVVTMPDPDVLATRADVSTVQHILEAHSENEEKMEHERHRRVMAELQKSKERQNRIAAIALKNAREVKKVERMVK